MLEPAGNGGAVSGKSDRSQVIEKFRPRHKKSEGHRHRRSAHSTRLQFQTGIENGVERGENRPLAFGFTLVERQRPLRAVQGGLIFQASRALLALKTCHQRLILTFAGQIAADLQGAGVRRAAARGRGERLPFRECQIGLLALGQRVALRGRPALLRVDFVLPGLEIIHLLLREARIRRGVAAGNGVHGGKPRARESKRYGERRKNLHPQDAMIEWCVLHLCVLPDENDLSADDARPKAEPQEPRHGGGVVVFRQGGDAFDVEAARFSQRCKRGFVQRHFMTAGARPHDDKGAHRTVRLEAEAADAEELAIFLHRIGAHAMGQGLASHRADVGALRGANDDRHDLSGFDQVAHLRVLR